MSRKQHQKPGTAGATDKDLAAAVLDALLRRGRRRPSRAVLEDLFARMYHASITREEARPVSFQICYIDPAQPDPVPPQRIVRDRWSFTRFPKELPMTVGELRKLAPASDPRSSSLAVFPDSQGHLAIWGLIDQLNRYQEFLNHEIDSGSERPGLFEARILGPGHIVAFIEYEKVAELHVDELQVETIDALRRGPLRKALCVGASGILARVAKNLSEADPAEEAYVLSTWINTICRILLRVQGFGHGGALLLTARQDRKQLNIKYPLRYARLRTSFESYVTTRIQHTHAWREIHSLSDKRAKALDWNLYWNEATLERDKRESESELESCAWFVALLTRVDGLVLLNPALDVLGFGVEITSATTEPALVERATCADATPGERVKVDYKHFGTRHRSMMRYCDSNPGSVGFVVSQDGDIRAMTKLGRGVVCWEDLRLQNEFSRKKRRGRKQANKPTSGRR